MISRFERKQSFFCRHGRKGEEGGQGRLEKDPSQRPFVVQEGGEGEGNGRFPESVFLSFLGLGQN